MKTKTFSFLIALFFLSSNQCPLISQTEYPRVRRIENREGLTSAPVLSIGKDKFGFAWIGTAHGIYRFDGMHMLRFPAEKDCGLQADMEFDNIYTDRQGCLWAVAAHRFILRYNYIEDKFQVVTELPTYTNINSIIHDDFDRLWIGTFGGLNLFDSISKLKVHADFFKNRKAFFRFGSVLFMQKKDESSLWLGVYPNKLLKFTINAGKTLVAEFHFLANGTRSQNQFLSGIIKDRQENYWLLLGGSLIKVAGKELSADTGNHIIPVNARDIYQPAELSTNRFSLCYDKENLLYFNVYNGIYSFDINQKKFRKIFEEAGSFFENNDHKINLFNDVQGNVLWTSIKGGLAIIDTRPAIFHKIMPESIDHDILSAFQISAFYNDAHDNLWIGTNGEGLYKGLKRKDGQGYTFEHFYHSNGNKRSISGNQVTNIWEPIPGQILVTSKNIQRTITQNGKTIFTDFKSKIRIDSFPLVGIIQVGGFSLILRIGASMAIFDDRNQKIYDFYLDERSSPFVGWQLGVSEDNQYFVREQNGIIYRLHFPLIKVENKGYRPSRYESLNDTDQVLKQSIWMFQTVYDNTKYFWFSTSHSGLLQYKLQEEDVKDSTRTRLLLEKRYETQNGLADNYVQSMIKDKKGRIWISTLNGLSCIIPGKANLYNFSETDGLPDNRLYPGFDLDTSGNIFVKYLKGLVFFNPDSLLSRHDRTSVVISKISVAGNPVMLDSSRFLHSSFSRHGSIDLPYKGNYLTLELTNLNFIDPAESYFRYKLEGFDKNWREDRVRGEITYGMLPIGNYRFHLYSLLKSGLLSSDELILDIHIKKPFYQTIFFFTILALVIFLLLIITYKIWINSLRKRAAWLEKTVQQKTAEILNQREIFEKLKSRFYTNISHEFRTPLTLINGSTDELSKIAENSGKSRLITTIRNSSNRLLKLVNELLDLAKLEAGTLNLRIENTNITKEIRMIVNTYLSDAERRMIRLSFSSDPEIISGLIDREYLEKIMHNLISNALKFTPPEGEISIALSMFKDATEIRSVKILVRDTGRGISNEHISRIFDRFYQVEDSDKKSHEGTGIGLSIVNELVKRHHGSIKVDSQLGKGTSFEIILPCGSKNFTKEEIITGTSESTFLENEILFNPEEGAESHSKNVLTSLTKFRKDSTILIAEDNEELRNFLAETLQKFYKVELAENGEVAYEKAFNMMPELILSDIMMPKSDGLELCRQVKENELTSHIPVILLTAKADMESKIQGLKTGADDYLLKPFNTEELFTRVNNLLILRKKLKQKFSILNSPYLTVERKNSKEDEFLSKIISRIEQQIVRNEFTIQELAMEMNISQRSLERKIFALTDLTPVEFIRKIRINYAAKLISEGRTDVSGAAYESGFLSLSYFSRVFKKTMGVSPTEFSKKCKIE